MSPLPVTEAEIQAYIDNALPEARRIDLEAYLATRKDEAERIRVYREQKLALKTLYNQVLDEPIPERLRAAARAPCARSRPQTRSWRLFAAIMPRVAAGVALAFIGAAAGWLSRGAIDARAPVIVANSPTSMTEELAGLARQAVMAHLVYSPEVRHPVEVGVDQEDHLVKWLSKRLGSPIRPPKLSTLGYDLIGGRLLSGSNGPVAQFMYQDTSGRRLTLYVSTENNANKNTGFRFAQEGPVNVFYWIDGKFGYALSGGIAKTQLVQLATSVYEQLDPG